MRPAVVCLLVLVAMATVDAEAMKKRFLTSDDDPDPRETFDQVGSAADFDTAVNALIPYIHSDMTVFACTLACQGAAASVLGPAAVLSGVLCPPLCEAALQKLEEIAG